MLDTCSPNSGKGLDDIRVFFSLIKPFSTYTMPSITNIRIIDDHAIDIDMDNIDIADTDINVVDHNNTNSTDSHTTFQA